MSEYSVDPKWKKIRAFVERVATDTEAESAKIQRQLLWNAMQQYVKRFPNTYEQHPDFNDMKVLFDSLEEPASRVQQEFSSLEHDAAGVKDLALLPMLMMGPSTTSPAEPTEQVEQQKEEFPIGWEHYADKVDAAAAKYEVPADMFWRLLKTENDIGNPHAKNPSTGAVGLGQIMPATAAEMGINPYNPDQAIDAAAKYLRGLNRELGSWEDAVAAYNWGPGNVKKYISDGGDMPAETSDYLKKIFPEENKS
jgi:soluble lytic murein transglycosylase-like protein